MTTEQKLKRLLVGSKGALAALSQKKTFPGDVNLAKQFLKDAIRAVEA